MLSALLNKTFLSLSGLITITLLTCAAVLICRQRLAEITGKQSRSGIGCDHCLETESKVTHCKLTEFNTVRASGKVVVKLG